MCFTLNTHFGLLDIVVLLRGSGVFVWRLCVFSRVCLFRECGVLESVRLFRKCVCVCLESVVCLVFVIVFLGNVFLDVVF